MVHHVPGCRCLRQALSVVVSVIGPGLALANPNACLHDKEINSRLDLREDSTTKISMGMIGNHHTGLAILEVRQQFVFLKGRIEWHKDSVEQSYSIITRNKFRAIRKNDRYPAGGFYPMRAKFITEIEHHSTKFAVANAPCIIHKSCSLRVQFCLL